MDDNQAIFALVRRCVGGDAAAWEELVRLHHRRIYNVCYRFTGSAEDAEDLSQEVFIRMYRTLGTYEPRKGAFTTWMTTMTRNLLVDHFRRSRHDRLTDSMDAGTSPDEDSVTLGEQLASPQPGPDRQVESGERQAMVQAALQKLSPELREAVILRDLQDLDYREIAQVLRVPEGTVKSRINRGRTELARLLSRTYQQGTPGEDAQGARK
ncbi:MAG: sigma-70 family RNA polymerase sigma factor [Acidobacteria bacterium]|nr:sigma-70 family RNA polymerase sigma factor [Acidobacteriota bacterium]